MKEYLTNEATGNKSSKRLWGTIFMVAGGSLLVFIGLLSLFVKIADPDTALRASTTLVWVGAALLGVGVLDGLGKKIGGK